MSSFATTGVDLEGIMISELNRERQLLQGITHMLSKKMKQTREYNKKETDSQVQRTNTRGERWLLEEGVTERDKMEQETKRYRLLSVKQQATGVQCTAQGIQPIWRNNYKWSITFKNCDCCAPETFKILYTNCTSIGTVKKGEWNRSQKDWKITLICHLTTFL